MKQLHLFSLLLFLLVAGAPTAFAQERTVTGRVTDAGKQPIVGATVTAKNSSVNTLTNSEGVFSIRIPSGVEKLIISSVGFAPQEISVNGKTEITVTLNVSTAELSEVVVTALNVERNKKSLQFSATTVDGSNFTQAREISTANALAGRVAGVNVTKIASGPSGSSRVVIRGAKTLGSNNNQPLYVVDGVPMDNTNFGQAGLWGGSDQGDGMTSLNPDDIASMTVLKGAAAAALYGSRAANGVILVTTKKGTGRRGYGVEFNSNFTFDKVQNLTDFQTTHGNGGYVGPTLQTQVAKTPQTLSEHWNNGWGYNGWGPKFDGSQAMQFDGIMRPYQYAGDNWDRFYQTGHTLTNSLAFTGGGDNGGFRLSLSDLRNDGVFPNSTYDRKNVSLASNQKIGKKLSVNGKLIYANEKTKNRPKLSDSPGNGNLGVYYTPGDVDIRNYIGDPNKPGAVPSRDQQQAQGITIFDGKAPGEEFQMSTNLWQQNPYWSAYQFRNEDTRDRIIASVDARFDINDFLYVSGQAGMDFFTLRNTQLTPQGTGYDRAGNMTETEWRTREVNIQGIFGFKKTFGDFGVDAYVGGNNMRRTNENISANGTGGFNTPFLAAINNARQRNFGYGYGKQGINSVFASAEVNYKGYLYLTGTAREDWFSVLNPEDNNILYPSVGASFVFTDAFKVLPQWLSFGKVRASWGQVGNVNSVAPYSTLLTYNAGSSHLNRPLGSYSSGDNLPNPDLKPFTSTELEFGTELRFFNNRLGIDIAYYDQKTTDDILNANISGASGYRTTSVNLGEISNKGLEFLITGTPVRSTITWDVSLNFAHNKSEVISLIQGQTEVTGEEPRTRTVFIKHIVGQPYGMITGITQKRDANGNLVFDEANGAPISSGTYNILGNGVPDFTGGINNSFTWKSLNLAFLIDFKSGGDIYSGTNVRMTQAGFTQQSLLGRAGEAPLTVTGVTADGAGGYKPFTKTLTPGEARNYWNQLGERAQENFVYDASFIKLRQVTLGYQVPPKVWGKFPMRSLMVSFVGRNLAIIKKNTPNIDPESSYTNSNSQGLDYFGFPATRSYGFNLRAIF